LDERVAPLLSDPNIRKVTYDLKDAMLRLRQHGLSVAPPYDDPLLMAYLLFPNRGKYELPDVVFDLMGQTVTPEEERTPWIDRLLKELAPRVERRRHSRIVIWSCRCRPSSLKWRLPAFESMFRCWSGCLEKWNTARRSHAPHMRDRGLRVQHQFAAPAWRDSVRQTQSASPRKLRKSGQYSTAVEILEELAVQHELPRLVLEYRQLAKFKSTYVDVIPKLIDPRTGRLHTSFHQAAASTGRLSSSNPNLQNIPVRADLGRKIRGAFIPEEGWLFVSADYSQVELRILAHLSADERLAEAFLAEEDIHRRTAAAVLGLKIEDVTSAQRSRAKAVNFGIVYGQTPYGLAQQLGISPEEAADFISKYFEQYQGVQRYIENC
jgi:DNA polymerase-1